MRMTKTVFNSMPDDIQGHIKENLRSFRECVVAVERGRYLVSRGAVIDAEYGADHKSVGVAYAEDFYTAEERIRNYISVFHDFPREYKGLRSEESYKMLSWLKQMKADGHEIPVRLVCGEASPPEPGRFCRKCGAAVWVSEDKDFDYHCFECGKDIPALETDVRPVVEGTKEDPGLKGFANCDEYCLRCHRITYNIPTDRVSLCAHCGEKIFPCSACLVECDWSKDEMKRHRFDHTDEWKAKICIKRQYN